ncbi:MAG: cupin domain-containing protein [Desulfobacteraceae bacterium]
MTTAANQPQFLDLGDRIKQDERGLAFFPFQEGIAPPEGPIILKSFHLVSILPGQVRGNHQHPHKREWLYVFNGEGNFVWQDDQGQRHQRRLGGNQTMVIIPPGIPHALQNNGPRVLYLLAWRLPEREISEPDTVPSPII